MFKLFRKKKIIQPVKEKTEFVTEAEKKHWFPWFLDESVVVNVLWKLEFRSHNGFYYFMFEKEPLTLTSLTELCNSTKHLGNFTVQEIKNILTDLKLLHAAKQNVVRVETKTWRVMFVNLENFEAALRKHVEGYHSYWIYEKLGLQPSDSSKASPSAS